MKALDWMRFLENQHRQHGKTLFRVAELANIAGRDAHALNVELARLVRKEVIARYAVGIYGLPGRATPAQLVSALDEGAYMTGAYALYRHNLITQAPTEITCFTNRRHNRSRKRTTPFGELVFVRVGPTVYNKPADGVLATPEQSLCDFVRMTQRQGLDHATLVTFRGLGRLSARRLQTILRRSPPTVANRVRQIIPRSTYSPHPRCDTPVRPAPPRQSRAGPRPPTQPCGCPASRRRPRKSRG